LTPRTRTSWTSWTACTSRPRPRAICLGARACAGCGATKPRCRPVWSGLTAPGRQRRAGQTFRDGSHTGAVAAASGWTDFPRRQSHWCSAGPTEEARRGFWSVSRTFSRSVLSCDMLGKLRYGTFSAGGAQAVNSEGRLHAKATSSYAVDASTYRHCPTTCGWYRALTTYINPWLLPCDGDGTV